MREQRVWSDGDRDHTVVRRTVELPRYDGHLFVWLTEEVCHVGSGRTAVRARVSGGDGRAGEDWTEPGVARA